MPCPASRWKTALLYQRPTTTHSISQQRENKWTKRTIHWIILREAKKPRECPALANTSITIIQSAQKDVAFPSYRKPSTRKVSNQASAHNKWPRSSKIVLSCPGSRKLSQSSLYQTQNRIFIELRKPFIATWRGAATMNFGQSFLLGSRLLLVLVNRCPTRSRLSQWVTYNFTLPQPTSSSPSSIIILQFSLYISTTLDPENVMIKSSVPAPGTYAPTI